MQDTDLHDEIMLAFREYFSANERWETKVSDRSGIDARNALGKIRILARKRRKEIQIQRKERMKQIRNARGEKK